MSFSIFHFKGKKKLWWKYVPTYSLLSFNVMPLLINKALKKVYSSSETVILFAGTRSYKAYKASTCLWIIFIRNVNGCITADHAIIYSSIKMLFHFYVSDLFIHFNNDLSVLILDDDYLLLKTLNNKFLNGILLVSVSIGHFKRN